MATELTTPLPSATRRTVWSRFLLRGESSVAGVGITFGAILLGAMTALGWWTLKTQQSSVAQTRRDEIRSVGALLSQTATALLADGDVNRVRKLMVEAKRDYQLTTCRVTLPGGAVVADDSGKATVKALPQHWTGSPVLDASQGGDTIAMKYPLSVSGRGRAALEIVAGPPDASWLYWETQTSVGVVGAVAMAFLLILYRRARAQLKTMGTISEALIAVAAGEPIQPALGVSASFGKEAMGWNSVLGEVESLRRQLLAQKTADAIGNRRGGKGELDAACDAMAQGLVLIDAQMKVKYANGAASIFLKTKREQIVGTPITGLLADEKLLGAIRSVAAENSRQRTIVELQRSEEDGGGMREGFACTLRFSVRPVRKDDFAAAMVVIEDITQQRVADEARNSFVAQATHELRTPLTNIRLYVETAIDDGDKNPGVRTNALNVINQEARRLERIVGEMLSVAEIEAGSFRMRKDDIYLDQLFEDLKGDYEAQAKEKQVELTFHLPPKLPVMKGDKDKVLVALHNLVGNGLKYTPAGGQVTVTVELKDQQLVVEVADTGIGISAEEAEKVFEKFYRAKDPRVGKITGTGLGLTLAREVVRLHGGDVKVQSELNKGSTFTVTLPMLPEAA